MIGHTDGSVLNDDSECPGRGSRTPAVRARRRLARIVTGQSELTHSLLLQYSRIAAASESQPGTLRAAVQVSAPGQMKLNLAYSGSEREAQTR